MKFITKISLSFFFALFVTSNICGQAYMRYKMKDGSFNGFYTDCIDSISHIKENGVFVQKVYSGAITKTIPVDNIIDISFESVKLNSNQDAGEYNIVEFDGKEGFKKAYVDNRATLIASKTGDFFANDTILLASVYNNTKCLFFTDENGRVSRFFDGKNYLIIDNDDDVFAVDDFSNTTRGVAKVAWNSFKKVWDTPAFKAFLKLNDIYMGYLVENLDVVANDPELHSQRCIFAGLSLAGALIEPVAYISSILAAINYDDSNPLKIFDDFYGGISGSFSDLLNEMYPDWETMEKYKEFYAKKYNLYLTASDATDITATSATLNGDIYTEDGLCGDLYFCFKEVNDNEEIRVAATKEYNKVNQWDLKGFKTGLKPDSWYMYFLEYVCTVDRLQLKFRSEPVDFETKPAPLPDLSGTWVFDQKYYGDNSLTIELILESSTKHSATYKAKSGYYGANQLSVTVNSDGSGSIGCWNSYGYTGSFSGTFNDSYTVLSGDSFYYGTNSWANPGWWVEESWSLHR